MIDHVTQRAESRVGAVLKNRWTLGKLIGVGGMAAVYKATHRNGGESCPTVAQHGGAKTTGAVGTN
jgi:hypothetical protein